MDVMGPRRCRRCVFPPFCQKSAIFSCCLPKKFLSGLRRAHLASSTFLRHRNTHRLALAALTFLLGAQKHASNHRDV